VREDGRGGATWATGPEPRAVEGGGDEREGGGHACCCGSDHRRRRGEEGGWLLRVLNFSTSVIYSHIFSMHVV